MIRLARFASSLSFVAMLVACGGGSDDAAGSNAQKAAAGPSGGVFRFEAAAEAAAASGGKVVVIWNVSSGSPDYLYAFGGGTTSGTQTFVSFSAAPPAEALNAGKLGVGIVGVVDASVDLPEGKISKDDFEAKLTLVSDQHAVIFRASPEQATSNGWDVGFPEGYSCGKCVRASGTFDSFAVEDCRAVKLVPASSADFCNWT